MAEKNESIIEDIRVQLQELMKENRRLERQLLRLNDLLEEIRLEAVEGVHV